MEVFVCVRTSFQMQCLSAYQPAGSLGTARHFAEKPRTVKGLVLFSIFIAFYQLFRKSLQAEHMSIIPFECHYKVFLRKKILHGVIVLFAINQN